MFKIKNLKNQIMNTRIYIIIIAAILLISTNPSYTQDRRTIETKVADILAQIPAEDDDHWDKMYKEIVNMGEGGLTAFCNMVVNPGSGDDTSVRTTIEGISKTLSGNGDERFRKLCALSYINAIEKANTWEVKDFFIRQLQFCGHDESVPILKRFLKHKMLSYPTARALTLIGSEKAEQALLETLEENLTTKPESMLEIIKSLGTLKSNSAIDMLKVSAESPIINVRKASLRSIAEIANPASQKILYAAAKKSAYVNDKTASTDSYILYANNLYKNKDSKKSLKIAQRLLKSCKDPNQLHTKSAALELIVKNKGLEAMPDLLKAVKHEDKKYRGSALRYANYIKEEEATDLWTELMLKVKPEVQVDIIDMLGERADISAAEQVRSFVNSDIKDLRISAVNTLSLLMGKKAMPDFIEQLTKYPDDNIKTQILNITDDSNISLLANGLDKVPEQSKAIIIDVLAQRKANQYYNKVYDYCMSSNRLVQESALFALTNLVSADTELFGLLSLLKKNENQHDIRMINAAIINAANQQKDKGFTISDLYKVPGNEAKIMDLLPEIGGEEALKNVIQSYKSSIESTQKASFLALTKWKDHTASEALFGIIEKTNNIENKREAIKGYVRQISNAPVTDDQKLLLLRKVVPYASGSEEKKQIISELGKLKTFLSLVLSGKYIDDPDVKQEAARAAMRIALPSGGQDNGLVGPVVEKILNKVFDTLEGAESEYDQERIINYNNETRIQNGFVPLFNGKDLSGWHGLVENPISRAKMSKEELAEKQKVADEKVKENWSVKDGYIVFNGKGNNLCTIKDYADFELILDWRITKKGDSGIYLRGTPQIQIWDTSRVEVGAQVGSGGLYNNSKHMSKPLIVADNPIGEWNTFRIKMIGEQVTVYLNGELVVDNVIMENYWDRNIPIFGSEAIELQAHGSDLAFRDIYVKELFVPEYTLSEEEKNEEFTVLFNGKNLNGWIGNKTDYVVEDGTIAIYPKRGGKGNLYTEKEYSDFNYRFDFQLTPGANNGLGIRTPMEGDAAYVGMELQILDNTASIYSNLEEYQYHGSVYGVIPAKRGFLKPVGEWNSQEVIAKGNNIKIILNGKVIVDGNILEASKNGTIDNKDHPGLLNKKGHIGFLGHGSILKFRNIRIKEL